jgi:hypothetical protein
VKIIAISSNWLFRTSVHNDCNPGRRTEDPYYIVMAKPKLSLKL